MGSIHYFGRWRCERDHAAISNCGRLSVERHVDVEPWKCGHRGNPARSGWTIVWRNHTPMQADGNEN